MFHHQLDPSIKRYISAAYIHVLSPSTAEASFVVKAIFMYFVYVFGFLQILKVAGTDHKLKGKLGMRLVSFMVSAIRAMLLTIVNSPSISTLRSLSVRP